MNPQIRKVKDAPENFIRSLAAAYISDNDITFEYLGDKCMMTPRMISDILYRGIAEAILDFETSRKVYSKVVYFRTKGISIRRKRWDKALEERKAFEKRKKQVTENHNRARAELVKKIQEVEFQLNSYDTYFTDEEGSPSKQDLENKLHSLKGALCLVR